MRAADKVPDLLPCTYGEETNIEASFHGERGSTFEKMTDRNTDQGVPITDYTHISRPVIIPEREEKMWVAE